MDICIEPEHTSAWDHSDPAMLSRHTQVHAIGGTSFSRPRGLIRDRPLAKIFVVMLRCCIGGNRQWDMQSDATGRHATRTEKAPLAAMPIGQQCRTGTCALQRWQNMPS